MIVLAERNSIRLVLPAYALVEPLEKLRRNRANRRQFAEDLDRELKQMSRSKDFSHIYDASSAVRGAMATKAQVDEKRYFEAVKRLRHCAEVLSLTSDALEAASEFQIIFGLGPQDALIFASVVEFLKVGDSEASVFANKNSKDFLAQDVVEYLGGWSCKVVPSFADTLSIVEYEMRKAREGGVE